MLCMEGREGMKPGGFMAAPEVGGSYQNPMPSPPPASAAPVVTRVENLSPRVGLVTPTPSAAVNPQTHQPAPALTPTKASAGLTAWPGMPGKKKRGRPRKYAPDGSVMPLNPTPISASLPPGEHSAPPAFSLKRGKGRPGGFLTKQQPRIELESLGEMVACSAGANFTPHIITVASGEDVTMKIMSFSQQGPRAICILSANGVVSNVTLRQPDSSGGTLTYEGIFELLSLSGSFMPNENGGTKSRSGGMSVSLASPDGRVLGGGVAGLLVAASPVQVVVGSFLPGYQLEQKTKKPKLETSAAMPAAGVAVRMPTEVEDTYSSGGQGQQLASTPKPSLTISSSFKGENWSASLHSSVPDSRNSATDINISLPGE
ncbi:AT-hook motif nuclear-localized protein 1 [Dendrobium catenatum]|uniref:AT-hook motif nuclear-localized protein 1 n=1 Tax=Dendrobium catenatum TaxID=906689 RepID=UPI0009F595A5|nr:AT-hook motif nuclear-localized protein 1 [Dendrobium catenatum]